MKKILKKTQTTSINLIEEKYKKENQKYKNQLKKLQIKCRRLQRENRILKSTIQKLDVNSKFLSTETMIQVDIVNEYGIARRTLSRHIKEKNLIPIKEYGIKKIFLKQDVEIFIKKFAIKTSKKKKGILLPKK